MSAHSTTVQQQLGCNSATSSLQTIAVLCMIICDCPAPLLAIYSCSEKLDVVRLTFYTAPVSLAYLLPLTLVYEVRKCLCCFRVRRG